MSETTKFKVTLEFEVDINPISVPDGDAYKKQTTPAAKKQKPMSEKDMRALMKDKGMSDEDISKTLAAKNNDKAVTPPVDPQFLIYPEYEKWAAAQQRLQQEIVDDQGLSVHYIREVVRDLTLAKVEALLEEVYGAPDLNGVIRQAMEKLSPEDKATLKSDQESLVHDESELVEDSVDCQFEGMTVTRV
jgi:hypothetical protein